MPDEGTALDFVPERRREGRTRASNQAILRFAEGTSEEVALADISQHGCSIQSEIEGLRIGRFVSIGIGQEPVLPAVIRWVRNGAAGMEFLRPIPAERREWHELIEMPF